MIHMVLLIHQKSNPFFCPEKVDYLFRVEFALIPEKSSFCL